MAGLTTTLMISAALGKTIVGAAGANSQAKAAKKQGDYQAQLLEQNATAADAQAADAISRGHEADLREYASGRQLIGSQRAAMGAQGISLTTGSPLDVVRSDEALNELDRRTIENNAAREAMGYRVEATNYRGQAKLTRLGASNAAAAYRSQGVQTLLGGAGDLFNIYQAYGMNKAPKTKATTPATTTYPDN